MANEGKGVWEGLWCSCCQGQRSEVASELRESGHKTTKAPAPPCPDETAKESLPCTEAVPTPSITDGFVQRERTEASGDPDAKAAKEAEDEYLTEEADLERKYYAMKEYTGEGVGTGTEGETKEAPEEKVPEQARPRKGFQMDLGSALDIITHGDPSSIALLKGSWLVKESKRSNEPLARRQALPPEAFWNVSQLQAAISAGDFGSSTRQVPNFVAVSYCWLSKEHPDPDGLQLRTLCSILELSHQTGTRGRDTAVFLDFGSLYQQPRSDQEQAAYELALERMCLIYGHPQIEVWLLAGPPEGQLSYEERAWPTFESAASQLRLVVHGGSMFPPKSTAAMILNLANLQSTGGLLDALVDWDEMVRVCRIVNNPGPLGLQAPKAFIAMLKTKRISIDTDLKILAKAYGTVFDHVVSCATALSFDNLNWGNSEVERLGEALPMCGRLAHLTLQGSVIGDAGCAALAAALYFMGNMQGLCLNDNHIGDGGAVHLAEALSYCTHLSEVYMHRNQIGDDGAVKLAGMMKSCSSLRTLQLARNKITNRGGLCFASALNESSIASLNLSENTLSSATKKKLEAAWKKQKKPPSDLVL